MDVYTELKKDLLSVRGVLPEILNEYFHDVSRSSFEGLGPIDFISTKENNFQGAVFERKEIGKLRSVFIALSYWSR